MDSKDHYTFMLFRTGNGAHRKLVLPVKQVKLIFMLVTPALAVPVSYTHLTLPTICSV